MKFYYKEHSINSAPDIPNTPKIAFEHAVKNMCPAVLKTIYQTAALKTCFAGCARQ